MKKVLILTVVCVLLLSGCVFYQEKEQKESKMKIENAVGQELLGGFVVTKNDDKVVEARGSVKVTGSFYIKEGSDCAYDCGQTCFTADQELPWRQEFCLSNSLLTEKRSGRAEMIIKELGIPFEGSMYAEVEQVKVLEKKNEDIKADTEETTSCVALTGGSFLCTIKAYGLNFITNATEAVLHTQYNEDYQHSIISFDKDIDIYIGKYTDSQKQIDPLSSGDFNPRDDAFQPFDFTVAGKKTYLSENLKGWCDGMSCSSPYVVCGFVNDGAWYAISFFGNGILDESEKEFLNNIKFTK